jgi:DNA-directed RNA polymerase specialized sigma24 family protein
MSEKLRTAFILFEIEGYSGEEIARSQDIPLGTVWTRLYQARKEFWKLVKEQARREGTLP